MHTNHKRQRGFSLIELMVVITIIALLGGIVGTNVFTAMKEANRDATRIQIINLDKVIKIYKVRKRKLPDSLQELADAELLDGDEVPVDAWGNEFYYAKEGSRDYDIISYGADGQDGGEDEDEDIDLKAARDSLRKDSEE